MCDMTHSFVWHDMTPSNVWFDWFIYVLHRMTRRATLFFAPSHVGVWCSPMCDMTHSHMRHDSLICVTWLIHVCRVNHSPVRYVGRGFAWLYLSRHFMLRLIFRNVWHDSFPCRKCLIRMFDMVSSYDWHDLFICVTWLIHKCDVTYSSMCVTHSYVCHGSFMSRDMTHPYVWHYVTWLVHVCDITHSYVWHDSVLCVTWLIHL